MNGRVKVSYTILCSGDTFEEISIKDMISNEKVDKIIKSEFAKGIRNLTLSHSDEATIFIKTQKEIFDFTVNKNDFADILVLAEEDAKKYKRLKKECDGVELVNIITID